MSNIAQAVAIFTTMRNAHAQDVQAARDGVNGLELREGQEQKELDAEKAKQNAQIDMMDFQGMMQLEQQLISTMSQITASEGRTTDNITKNI